MHREKIYPYQLFSLIFIFELGSAVLFALGIDAKQDAWLAMIFAYIGGIALVLVYNYLYQIHKCGLVEYLVKTWGKYIGNLLSSLYIIYFIYIAARVSRDFGELTKITTFPKTPLSIVIILNIIVITYGICLGFETVARIVQIYFSINILLIIAMYTLLAFSKIMDFNALLPVMEGGIVPVIKAAYPLLLTFPFGELIAFTPIFPLHSQPQKTLKVILLAITFSAMVLTLNNIIIVSILGAEEAARMDFPLYSVVTMINLGFFKNVDSVVVLLMVINGFFKICVFYYASIESIQKLFNLSDYKPILIPLSALVVALSLFIAQSYPFHIYLGLKITPLYIHIPMQVIIPVLTLLLSKIKTKDVKRP